MLTKFGHAAPQAELLRDRGPSLQPALHLQLERVGSLARRIDTKVLLSLRRRVHFGARDDARRRALSGV